MEPDGWLVENEDNPLEGASKLPRKPNSLDLSTGKARGRATETEVAKTDLFEEAQPAGYFGNQGGRNLGGGAIQLECIKKNEKLIDRQLAEGPNGGA